MTRKLVSALSLGALALAACSDAPTVANDGAIPVVAPPANHDGDNPGTLGNHSEIAPKNLAAVKANGDPLEAGNVVPLGTAVKLTWSAPSPLPAGYSLQRYRYVLSGDAATNFDPVAGNIQLNSGSPALAYTTSSALNPGTYTFSVSTEAQGPKHNGQNGSENHYSLRVSITFHVQAPPSGPQPNVISFAFPGTFAPTYGGAPFVISDVSGIVAQASSGLDLAYASKTPAVCDIADGSTEEVLILGAGTCTIEASQGGNDDFVAATNVSSSFTVLPAQIAVNANNASTTYGVAPTLSASLSGFVNNENATTAGIQGQAACSIASGTSTDAGTYNGVIGCDVGTLSAANYTFVKGSAADLTINKASLTITADDKSKAYDGQAFTGFTVAYSGFVAGENASALGGTLAFGGSAAGAINAGTYTITPGGLTSNNYAITFVNGSLSITRVLLTVTADDQSKAYDGLPFTGFTVQYDGFVNSEGPQVLGGTLTFGPAATAVAVGTHAIVPGGLTSPNYSFSYVPGTLTISAWALSGFYQPVGENQSIRLAPRVTLPGSSTSTIWNSVKGGSTVPLKFNVFNAATNGIEIVDASKATFSATKLNSCTGSTSDDPILATELSTGNTTLRYDPTAGQFIQNWKTPTVSSESCYRATVTTADGSTISAFFKLKK